MEASDLSKPKIPDPPAYYKLFVNGPDDLKPPDIQALSKYSIQFPMLERVTVITKH